MTTHRRTSRGIDKGYTDELVLLGADQRETQNFLDYLLLDHPEVLVGYNVRLVSIQDARALYGRRPSAYIVSPLARRHQHVRRLAALAILQAACHIAGGRGEIRVAGMRR